MDYRANGKLLIFGEYFVLDGCPALAFPTRFGQNLHTSSDSVQVKGLHWKSFNHKDEIWFEAYFDEELRLLHGLHDEVAERLEKILQTARSLNPGFLRDGLYHEAKISADYPTEWGLGSSSTLISLIAQWADVNAMQLFFQSFTGSGYDIACATAKGPILYELKGQLSKWSRADIRWDFLDRMHFVYLGQKQDSREGIARYRSRQQRLSFEIQEMSELVSMSLNAASTSEFIELAKKSESIISKSLGLEKVQDQLFPDFPGVVKSLGAWGGDFVLALANDVAHRTPSYFREKGYEVIYPANEILLY